MTLSRYRRRSLASLAGLFSVLIVSSPVAAAEWSEPVVFSGFAVGGDIVAITSSRAVLLYSSYHPNLPRTQWLVRRTTNGGRSWSRPRRVSTLPTAISGVGKFVDLLTVRDGRVSYSRSTNSGKSFGRPVALSDAGAIQSWDVARGPKGLVAVIWHVKRGPTYVRVSLDGGRSFGRTHTATTAVGVRYPSVAVGGGVIYVAYESPEYTGQSSFARSVPERPSDLKVRRSVDNAQTWSASTLVSDDADAWTLAAGGGTAYVAYTDWDRDAESGRFATIQYKATSDAGQTWSEPRQLAPMSWNAMLAAMTVDNGVAHATFERCDPSPDNCLDRRVYYRYSSNAMNWSTPERVSPKWWDEAHTDAVDAIGGRVYALYTAYRDGEFAAVQVR